MAELELYRFDVQHLQSSMDFIQASHESFMTTVTRRLDALEAMWSLPCRVVSLETRGSIKIYKT